MVVSRMMINSLNANTPAETMHYTKTLQAGKLNKRSNFAKVQNSVDTNGTSNEQPSLDPQVSKTLESVEADFTLANLSESLDEVPQGHTAPQ